MGKKMEETTVDFNEESAVLDFVDEPIKMVPVETTTQSYSEKPSAKQQRTETDNKTLVNCLRNQKVIVRYILRQKGNITNPKHVLYGGMAEGASRTFVVPQLTSGKFVNVLTDNEKAFLEHIMGLEPNALSIFKKTDNFWSDQNPLGISRVRLTKRDTYLDLSSPEDYIRYKILLANKNLIAPSLAALQDYPKASYQYVIIEEGAEDKQAADKMSTTMKCYKEYGKIETDKDILRLIVETIDGRPIDSKVKLEFLQSKINEMIQADSRLFLKIITDPLLSTKVLIRKSIDAGFIAKRGNFLYLKADNTPLCEDGEEPTMQVAAKYLNSPKRQDILFALEAKLK
ncbi:MAG: hypothetical protein U0K68_01400 [Agathobacter sp.]|nr:hypothetical protein [Agathobacter sp.]